MCLDKSDDVKEKADEWDKSACLSCLLTWSPFSTRSEPGRAPRRPDSSQSVPATTPQRQPVFMTGRYSFDRVLSRRQVFCCFVKRVIRRHLWAVNHCDVARCLAAASAHCARSWTSVTQTSWTPTPSWLYNVPRILAPVRGVEHRPDSFLGLWCHSRQQNRVLV